MDIFANQNVYKLFNFKVYVSKMVCIALLILVSLKRVSTRLSVCLSCIHRLAVEGGVRTGPRSYSFSFICDINSRQLSMQMERSNAEILKFVMAYGTNQDLSVWKI